MAAAGLSMIRWVPDRLRSANIRRGVIGSLARDVSDKVCGSERPDDEIGRMIDQIMVPLFRS